jgi:hypothetical protein
MKSLFIGVLVLGIIGFLIGPTLLVQKKCYDTAQANVSEINQFVVTRGLTQHDICEKRFYILSELKSCVNDPENTGKFTSYKELIASELIPYIRPLTSTVEKQQAQHDAECSEYKTLMFSGSL